MKSVLTTSLFASVLFCEQAEAGSKLNKIKHVGAKVGKIAVHVAVDKGLVAIVPGGAQIVAAAKVVTKIVDIKNDHNKKHGTKGWKDGLKHSVQDLIDDNADNIKDATIDAIKDTVKDQIKEKVTDKISVHISGVNLMKIPDAMLTPYVHVQNVMDWKDAAFMNFIDFIAQ